MADDHGQLTRNEITLIRELVDERLLSIRNLVKAQFDSHERVHEALRIAMDEFKNTLNLRLEGMNEFRAQINKAEASYVRKDTFDNKFDELADRINRLENSQWMIAGGLSVLVFAIQILSKYLR